MCSRTIAVMGESRRALKAIGLGALLGWILLRLARARSERRG